MNRKDFHSAYDKITLSDECRAEMKKKLMAAMEQKKSDMDFTDDEMLHTTQEIKIAPRKRSAGKTAAIVGSAAAVVAVFAVGMGVMLNRNDITQPQPVTSNGTQESGETSQTQQTAESTEPESVDFNADSIKTACGTLRFQELSETNAEHSEPGQQFTDSAAAVTEMRSRWHIKTFSSLGWDEVYAQNHGLEWYEDYDGGDDVTDTRPLGEEVPYSDGYYSDTGMTLIYRSEDGTKQANLSISTVGNEFIPITLPDGSYLTASGEPESLFSRESYKNFIDPEYDLKMSVGTYTDGADTYYTAYYYLDTTSPESYVRIDAKNITREQFIACIAKNAYQYRIQDHKGYYAPQTFVTTWSDGASDEGFDIVLPGPKKQETEWGELDLNTLTYFFTTGYTQLYSSYGWNVEYRQSVTDGDVPYYTLDELPELTGVDMIDKLDIPEEFAVGSGAATRLDYRAAYEGICTDGAADWAQDYGVNTEMLPGDDPEEFTEAQKYVETVIDYDEDGSEVELPDHYTTDKLAYFRDKKRTSFYADLIFECGEKRIDVKVLDNWKMYGDSVAFGQHPISASSGFITGADGNGTLYTGWGEVQGDDVYLGGFKNADGKYIVVSAQNVGCRAFAKILAQLYTGQTDPQGSDFSDYPAYSYDLEYHSNVDVPFGRILLNRAVQDDYTPRSDFEYFTSADEAVSAEQSVIDRDFTGLMDKRGWKLDPEQSAILAKNADGTPAGVSLYFTNGDKAARVNFGQYDRYADLRITLPGSKTLRPGGDGYESSITNADIYLKQHYFDTSAEWQAGICGRISNGVPYYRFETSNQIKPVIWSVDTCGADESEVMDIVAMALYGQADRNASFSEAVGEDITALAYDLGMECDTQYGFITPNPLVSYYCQPNYSRSDVYPHGLTSDTGELDISAEEAAVFIAANTAGSVAVPFEADGVTMRSITADGGYSSESVTYSLGDVKSLRICKINNGDALAAYGEEFGPDNIMPYRTTLNYNGKRTRIVTAGAKVPTGEYWLYAISDGGNGKYTTVTAKGLSIEEFAKVLAEVYLG